MTMRTRMNRQMRWIMAVAIGALFFAAAPVVAARLELLENVPPYAIIPAVIVFVVAVEYANFLAFKCSRCGRRWGALAIQSGCLIHIDTRLKYCPFCGCNIDEAP
jgi:hypothetical protein